MRKLLFITVILFACLSSKADVQHKTIEKKFKLGTMKELVVQNRNGQVQVEQWDKDEIEIKVDIKVDAGDIDKLKAILDKIDVSFVQKADYLTVLTDFADNFKISNFTNKLFFGGSVQVDYVIYIPNNMSFKLINENGNVFIGDFVGDLSIDIKEGDLKLGNALGSSSISVNSGRVDISKLGITKCVFENNKEVNIKNVEKINIDAKHSKINILEAKTLVISSSRSEFNLGLIASLRGSSSMTDFVIQDIGEELVFDLWFGSINVRNIHNMFSLVDIKTERAKTGLTFMQGSAYDIQIRHHKNVDLDLPSDLNLKKLNTADSKVFISEAKYGGENKFNSKVNINAVGCKLFIQ